MTRPANRRPTSLFHAIVVMGAAVGTGCGSDESIPDAPAAVADARTDASPADAAPADASGDAADAMIIIL